MSDPQDVSDDVVAIKVGGLPVSVAAAMLTGIVQRWPDAAWVLDPTAPPGSTTDYMRIRLGPEVEDDWDADSDDTEGDQPDP